jgi:hypothetical protein
VQVELGDADSPMPDRQAVRAAEGAADGAPVEVGRRSAASGDLEADPSNSTSAGREGELTLNRSVP